LRYITFTLLGAMVLMPIAASAITYSDNFDDGVINSSLWAASALGAPTVTEQSGRLELAMPGTSSGDAYNAGYYSVPKLVGDFDAVVDFDHLTWPANNGVRTALGVYATGYGFQLERTCMSSGGGEYVLIDANGSLSFAPYSATTGRLRITRIGARLTGYYYDNGWQIVNYWDATTADMNFCLWTWSDDRFFGHQNSLATFDNFQVTDSAVPEPITLVTCGLGLGGLLLRRKNR